MKVSANRTVLFICVLIAAAAILTIWLVEPADAQTEIVVDIDTVRRVGNQACDPADFCSVTARLEVPADLVGLSCTVTAVSTNNVSAHPGNDLVVQSWNGSADEVRIGDVEAESFTSATASGRLELGDWWQVFVDIGPDGVFSGGLTVVVSDCINQTTTTTQPTTTTTEVPPSTTTTTSPSSTPTLPPTTTTSVPSSTTSTFPTTTSPTTTTDTPSESPPSTVPPSTTTTSLVEDDCLTLGLPECGELPFTGFDPVVLAGVGFVLLVSGAALRRITTED